MELLRQVFGTLAEVDQRLVKSAEEVSKTQGAPSALA
jgi:hypothetical protein